MNIPSLTDKELFELCREYGTKALVWRKKFIGLLPEVNRRKLYERKGCSSIFEFAAKLCGLSKDQVYLALNLEKRFEDKPALKALLINGEESINKLARIASIATPENEEELANKIKLLPVKALNTLVRDERRIAAAENENGLGKALFDTKGLYVQTFQLADDVIQEFNELYSKGIDVNEFLRKMLKQRREEIAKTKEKIAADITNNGRVPLDEAATNEPTISRYIPVQIKKILQEEYGKKCSIQTCKKPSKTIHHTQRFSLRRNHDPRFLAPLCSEHHVIAHSIDLKYHQARAPYIDAFEL